MENLNKYHSEEKRFKAEKQKNATIFYDKLKSENLFCFGEKNKIKNSEANNEKSVPTAAFEHPAPLSSTFSVKREICLYCYRNDLQFYPKH